MGVVGGECVCVCVCVLEAHEDRNCGETRTGVGGSKGTEPGPEKEGEQQGGIGKRGSAAVFLTQGHMGLVIPLVTWGTAGDGKREQGRVSKRGHGHQDQWTLAGLHPASIFPVPSPHQLSKAFPHIVTPK